MGEAVLWGLKHVGQETGCFLAPQFQCSGIEQRNTSNGRMSVHSVEHVGIGVSASTTSGPGQVVLPDWVEKYFQIERIYIL